MGYCPGVGGKGGRPSRAGSLGKQVAVPLVQGVPG